MRLIIILVFSLICIYFLIKVNSFIQNDPENDYMLYKKYSPLTYKQMIEIKNDVKELKNTMQKMSEIMKDMKDILQNFNNKFL